MARRKKACSLSWLCGGAPARVGKDELALSLRHPVALSVGGLWVDGRKASGSESFLVFYLFSLVYKKACLF